MNDVVCISLACLMIGGSALSVRGDEEFAQGPADDVTELKALDRLRGEWSCTVEGGNIDYTQSSRWILDGRVLESKFDTGMLNGLILRTYDAEDNQFVATYMDSDGGVVLMTGQWDENQQSLSTTGKNGGDEVTLTTRFLDDGITQWTITQTSPGQETTRISGTNRRVRR